MDYRILDLGDADATKTGYYLELDKTGLSRTQKCLYSTIISDAVAAAVPTITTRTFDIVSATETITSQTSKSALIGKLLTIQSTMVFTMGSVDTIAINMGFTAAGVTGQSLNAVVVEGSTPAACKCYMSGTSTINITKIDGTNFGSGTDFTLYINGTLITT